MIVSSKEHFDSLRIPIESIKSGTNTFGETHLIGVGRYGRVYRGQLSDEQGRIIPVAIRRLDRSHGRVSLLEMLMLSSYKHQNLDSLVGFCDEGDEMILVFRYQSRGSLYKYLSSTELTWTKRLQICVGVARGLSYLHVDLGFKQVVVHPVLKSSNILLDENWEAKITNFRLAGVNTDAMAADGYVDPTYVKTGILTKESDVYSFGVVLFELLCGRPALVGGYEDDRRFLARLARRYYEDEKLDAIIDPILRKQMDPNSWTTFSSVAYQCLNEHRHERPTMDRIVQTLERVLELQREFQAALARKQEGGDLKEEASQDDYYKLKNLEHMKIPFEDIKLATGDFDNRNSIGMGGFGIVYKAELFHFDTSNFDRENPPRGMPTQEPSVYQRRQSQVAIKRLDPRKGQGRAEFLQEISLLSNFRHQNLITLIGFCDEGHENILVYEHASKGSLDKYINRMDVTNTLTWAQRLQICLDAARGLYFLHDGVGEHHRIIHRDIKSSNILLGRNWEGKISDFGLSRIGPANLQATFLMTQVAGTLEYIDPQYHKTGMLTKESDVYSFGVVLYEVLCGRLAFYPRSKSDPEFLPHMAKRCFEKEMVHEIIDPHLRKEFEKRYPDLDDRTCPDSVNTFAAVAYKCLQEKYADRPKMADVVEELMRALKFHVKGVEVLRTSVEVIKSATNNFSEENVIGKGGFGKIYRGELSHSKGRHSMVTVKRLDPMMRSYGEEEFYKEVTMLFSYNHDNVLPLLHFCEEANEKIIVFEDTICGTLNKHLNDTRLTWIKRLKICMDSAKGLDYIHSGVETQHRVHGDIKSSSILLNHEWKAAISDFIIFKGEGTLGYLDPLYTTGILTKESDVYSFGVVLFEILSGISAEITKRVQQKPLGRIASVEPEQSVRHEDGGSQVVLLAKLATSCFEDKNLHEIIFPPIKEEIEANSLDIFSKVAYQCLQEDRGKRPTMAKVLEELEKAFGFQDEWEWEQKLPSDYDSIMKMSKSPALYSTRTKKELYSLLSSGLLLDNGTAWCSLSMDGAVCEMVSARKFSYQSLRYFKWRSTRQSRFLKMAKMSDISNLNVQVKIRTQFLSPGVIYGAYLVFKFGDQVKVSSHEPIYVNLKYRISGGTLNAYIAEWRDEEWMMIELCCLISHHKTTDFEVLLKSFSDYSCSTGAIFIEGIEFRPVDNVVPEEKVERSLNTDSNIDWDQQLPSGYQEIFKRSQDDVLNATEEELYLLLSKGILIDKCEKLFSLSHVKGKKCHMLPAKAVIYNASNVGVNCEPPAQSRFAEVVRLLCHKVFRIKCNIETQMMSPDTTYACYLVFKQPESCFRPKHPVKVQDLLSNNDNKTKIIYLKSPNPVNLHRSKRFPKQREDGWMEVIVWELFSSNKHSDDYFPMDLKLICFEATMHGMFVCGIEFRPI